MGLLGFGSSRRIAEADSVAVIGLGRFGSALARELMAAGTEVLGIDADEEIVQVHNGELTQVVRADSTKRETLDQLAVGEFDRVVLAIGDDVQGSILTASLLLQQESRPVIWAKANSDQHGMILRQLGVVNVIYPEADMGRRVAHLVRGAAMDYLEIGGGYALVRTVAPSVLLDSSLGDSAVRRRHGVTIAAVRPEGGEWHNAESDTVLAPGSTVLVVGPSNRVEAFAQLR